MFERVLNKIGLNWTGTDLYQIRPNKMELDQYRPDQTRLNPTKENVVEKMFCKALG